MTENSGEEKQQKPLVLVLGMSNEETRGDIHGQKGVAQAVAGKIGGEMVFLNEKVLRAHYPSLQFSMKKGRYQEKAIEYLNRFGGKPAILFSSGAYNDFERKLAAESVIHISSGNEFKTRDIPEAYAKFGHELVPHHLTPAVFKAEKEKFEARYRDLPGPLFAVIVTGLYMHEREKANLFVKNITDICKYYPQASLFICSSARTDDNEYDLMMKSLSREMKEKGISKSVKLLSYNLNRAREKWLRSAFNPYAGLLARADHVIVLGNSFSVISEAIAAGKRVYCTDARDYYTKLETLDLVRDFRQAVKGPLEESAVVPLGVTDSVADKIAAEYRAKMKTAPSRRCFTVS